MSGPIKYTNGEDDVAHMMARFGVTREQFNAALWAVLNTAVLHGTNNYALIASLLSNALGTVLGCMEAEGAVVMDVESCARLGKAVGDVARDTRRRIIEKHVGKA